MASIGLDSLHEENWKRRTVIVEYCVDVVDQSMAQKRETLQKEDLDPATQRKVQGALYAEEVKVRLLTLRSSKFLMIHASVHTISVNKSTTNLPSRGLCGIGRLKV